MKNINNYLYVKNKANLSSWPVFFFFLFFFIVFLQIRKTGLEVIQLFSCSTQLSMKFSPLINMKTPTIVGIFIFYSRENFMHSYI